MLAVQVPGDTVAGSSSENDSVAGVELMLAGALTTVKTAVPCCKVSRVTTLPLPLVESSTKLIFIVDPRANEDAACPAAF